MDVDGLTERMKRVEKAIMRSATSSQLTSRDTLLESGKFVVSQPLTPLAQPRMPAPAPESTTLDLIAVLGVEVGPGTDGAVVLTVDPEKLAHSLGLTAGTIISHVGRAAVRCAEELVAAAGEAPSVKLTTFDPSGARVRMITVNR